MASGHLRGGLGLKLVMDLLELSEPDLGRNLVLILACFLVENIGLICARIAMKILYTSRLAYDMDLSLFGRVSS